MRRLTKRSKVLSSVAVAAAAVVWSFASFVSHVGREVPASLQKADGIIVLTGGDRRLAAGMRLLENGAAKRLLVSGVNRETSREMLRRVHNVRPSRLFSCCTDLGYEASDTAGNASEARDWVERQGFKSLIVVTANYHMPRSLAELAHVMPDVRLVAHPVDPRGAASGPWWSDSQMVRAMGREYVKYVRCTARMRLTQAVEFLSGREKHAGANGSHAPVPPVAPAGTGPI